MGDLGHPSCFRILIVSLRRGPARAVGNCKESRVKFIHSTEPDRKCRVLGHPEIGGISWWGKPWEFGYGLELQ